MRSGKTILCQEDPGKRNAECNYQPISYLPLMWNLMTGIIAYSVYEYLEMYNLLPVEQKRCRRNGRRTKDQLLIDKKCCMIVRRETLIEESNGLIDCK